MSELGVKDNTCRVVKRGFSAVGTRHEAKYSEYPTVEIYTPIEEK